MTRQRSRRYCRTMDPWSEEERKRRQAIYLFVAVYLLFMLAVIIIMAFRSHELGYGWL